MEMNCLLKRISVNNRNDLRKEFISHLGMIFSYGLLKVECINWNNVNCGFVEEMGKNEQVIPITNWQSMKMRISDNNFRCYVAYHPSFPLMPLMSLYIRLSERCPKCINELFDTEKLKKGNCGIFYSISLLQPSLSSLNLGNWMIRQVVNELKENEIEINKFFTLSPIRNFSRWLNHQNGIELSNEINSSNYHNYQKELTSLMFNYLKNEKGNFRDPVAKFHQLNGAKLTEIHWEADSSILALENSFGMMATYEYVLDELDDNSLEYRKNERN
ncbi:hypothetical protein SNEBB_008642 [Seison nebaliae]|nr:hypothetical protein SNEBB_008642 [Seison nebaliae]